jgi:3-hydroxybutyrate dehydrogenase
MDLHLEGKVVLITGAGGGIGRETAALFAQEGAAVVCADQDEARAQAAAEVVRATGPRALGIALDVTSAQDVERAVAQAEASVGPIDVLVNAAGIYHVGTIGEIDERAWDRLLDINLKGTFLVCRAVLPRMLERGRGSIVNLASISGRTRSTLAAPSYVASKAGVIGRARCARERGGAGAGGYEHDPRPVF